MPMCKLEQSINQQMAEYLWTKYCSQCWEAIQYQMLARKKLISQSKKEMENFTWVRLRIITQEQPLRMLWELFHSLEVKAQLYKVLRPRTVL